MDTFETFCLTTFLENIYLLQIVLIGTQADLKYECEDPVTNESGERLAREIQAVGYVETSAKTGEGVHKAIQMGIKAVLKDDGDYDLISRGINDSLEQWT